MNFRVNLLILFAVFPRCIGRSGRAAAQDLSGGRAAAAALSGRQRGDNRDLRATSGFEDGFQGTLVAARMRTSTLTERLAPSCRIPAPESRAGGSPACEMAGRRFRRETSCRRWPGQTHFSRRYRAGKGAFLWPKNSDSSSASGISEQLTLTEDPRAIGLA